jgi:predicted dehydrogenase
MIDVCQKSGVKLAVDHHRRGDSRYHKAKQLIADGAIGDLYLLNSIYFNQLYLIFC